MGGRLDPGGLLKVFLVGYILLWDRNRRQLWAKMASTIVVDDPDRVCG